MIKTGTNKRSSGGGGSGGKTRGRNRSETVKTIMNAIDLTLKNPII